MEPITIRTDAPPVLPARRQKGRTRNPWNEAMRALPVGGWLVVPPALAKTVGPRFPQWGKRAGYKVSWRTSDGDQAKGVERGAVVVIRLA